MGVATSKVRLNICGSSYVVNTTESEDYMQNLADRLNLDMNELMTSSNSISITTAAIMTALNYRDELEKASGSADNMRRQIKDYLEDAASAKMAAEEVRRENASLKRRIDDLERRLRRAQTSQETLWAPRWRSWPPRATAKCLAPLCSAALMLFIWG